MTAFFNPWVLLTFVLAIAGAAGGGYYKGNSAGKSEVQQAWDKEKAEQYAAYAKGQEEARQREQEMQQAADKLRREKDAQIRDINARATALTNSLRDRFGPCSVRCIGLKNIIRETCARDSHTTRSPA